MTTARDAVRLAHQASFGPNETLVAEIQASTPANWIGAQMKLKTSRYTRGGTAAVHQWTVKDKEYCDGKGDDCWRDNFSTTPLLWDFYRNAVSEPDQLRQRVAFALGQIVVTSGLEVSGTYGFRLHHNNLLDLAFDNYRQVLKKTALSPVMGDFLNNANNDKAAPNENFARELLQLFAIGTCELTDDGSLKGGKCLPTYDNATVRAYAYALTGWTYAKGGATSYGCWPEGANCRYYGGDMVAVARYHDSTERTLLAGIKVPAGSTAEQALEKVLDSLMVHPNTAPFVARHLIQQLVTSNPSAAYVARVATAFRSGKSGTFGAGVNGDLAATVAAVLLDAEARNEVPARRTGQLREPALMFTGVLRALNGRSDGDALGWWWGETMRQHVHRSPSVFNYYPPDYPLPGNANGLVGPAFALHNANSALERLNYLTYLLWWGGSAPETSVPGAIGTRVDLSAFQADVADPAKLVDRFSKLAYGAPLPAATRTEVIRAVQAFDAGTGNDWQSNRVKQAAYLVFGAPQYQVIR